MPAQLISQLRQHVLRRLIERALEARERLSHLRFPSRHRVTERRLLIEAIERLADLFKRAENIAPEVDPLKLSAVLVEATVVIVDDAGSSRRKSSRNTHSLATAVTTGSSGGNHRRNQMARMRVRLRRGGSVRSLPSSVTGSTASASPAYVAHDSTANFLSKFRQFPCKRPK